MCSAFTPDCGYYNSTFILIGDVYCSNTKCLGKLCLHIKLFNLLAEMIINVRNVGLCVSCANLVLKIKQIPFSCRLVKGFTFWREPKISSRLYWRCLLSWQVLFQQREMRISWWLCKNSEIHLCLWNVWSLVVCSQSSFYVTRAQKRRQKQTKHAFSSLEKGEPGTQQTIIT